MYKIFAQQLVDPAPLPQPGATNDNLQQIFTIVFVVIGALAFLMLVIAGFRYVLSQGDPNKVAEAKNQIIYSLVGLIIAVLAWAIVNFVLGRVG